MPVSRFLPIAAAAAVPVVRQVTGGLSSGVSFVQKLAREVTDSPPAGDQVQRRAAEEVPALGPLQSAPADHLHRLAQNELERFLDRLREKLAAHGIETDPSFVLKSDGRRGVILASDHPDRAAIEQLFASDQELAHRFHRLAAAVQSAARLEGGESRDLAGELRLEVGPQRADVHLV